MEKIMFETEDGVKIAGNYWKGSDPAVLLLHMMPSVKESWNDFAEALNRKGMAVLAIDLRGHGQSTAQGENIIDFRTFSDKEHQASIKDVEAAISYLKQNGVSEIFMGGASIGANLALQYQSGHPEIKKVFLLSAGLNYRGILTEPMAAKLRTGQTAYIAAGTMDGPVIEAAKALSKIIKGSTVKTYETPAHGTDLLIYDAEDIIAWLD